MVQNHVIVFNLFFFQRSYTLGLRNYNVHKKLNFCFRFSLGKFISYKKPLTFKLYLIIDSIQHY